MAKRDRKHARRKARRPRRKPRRKLSNAKLSQRSQSARDCALHVLAAMRRDPNLSLTHAAKLEGVKRETVRKYFPSALKESHGQFRVTKSDRYVATLYIPDAHGNSVPLRTRSSRERTQASQYLRDLGRYLRGNRSALARWHGKEIAGVKLVTAGRTIVAIEPALSEFALYRAFNGDAA
jgi:hypothetical protein